MSNSLRDRLSALAASFAAGVLDVVRRSSLQELVAVPPRGQAAGPAPRTPSTPTGSAPPGAPAIKRGSGRLRRRSSGDIAQALDQIVSLLKDHAGGLRAEEIRQELGLQAKEMPRPLKEGLDTGRLGKSGQKRATTYFAKAGKARAAGEAAAPPSRGARTTRKAARTARVRAAKVRKGQAARLARRKRP